MYQLSDFDFELPTELIAQHPAARRTDSRLLVVGNADMQLQDRQFRDFVDLVNPGDLLVFNDSRVIKARLHGTKPSGGQVEILVERILNEYEALALMRVSKKPRDGSTIHLARSDAAVTVLGRDEEHADRFRLQFSSPVLQVLASAGEVPLPPYITHAPDEQDIERYQTVYARTPGSVAAPTAGLHFDEEIFSALKAKGVNIAYVTLHVGTGTFAPVRTENIEEHRMHSEWYEISQETADLVNQTKREGKRVIAIGTTSLRTLESAGSLRRLSAPRDDKHQSSLRGSDDVLSSLHGPIRAAGVNELGVRSDEYPSSLRGPGGAAAIHPGTGETDIFIYPGFRFQVVDALLTNFHLPRSTLLMLVTAFIGYDRMRAVYRHAVASRYRFFSYGDAMFCSQQS